MYGEVKRIEMLVVILKKEWKTVESKVLLLNQNGYSAKETNQFQ